MPIQNILQVPVVVNLCAKLVDTIDLQRLQFDLEIYFPKKFPVGKNLPIGFLNLSKTFPMGSK